MIIWIITMTLQIHPNLTIGKVLIKIFIDIETLLLHVLYLVDNMLNFLKMVDSIKFVINWIINTGN